MPGLAHGMLALMAWRAWLFVGPGDVGVQSARPPGGAGAPWKPAPAMKANCAPRA